MVTKDMLHFPENLTIRLIAKDSGEPIPNIAVTLTVYAREKNNYHLGPPLSNSEGEISITAIWVNQAIQHVRNSFLMDYVTPMQDCLPQVNIKVMSLKDIERAISAMRIYNIENGSLDIAHSIAELQNSNNNLYLSKEVYVNLVDPNKTTHLVPFELEKKTFDM